MVIFSDRFIKSKFNAQFNDLDGRVAGLVSIFIDCLLVVRFPAADGKGYREQRRSRKTKGQGLQITGLDLVGGHGPGHRRQAQDDPQHGGQGPVMPQDLVVEQQVLQVAPFDGHHHRPVGAVQGCEHPIGPVLEG
jgi:hypothetical protein